MGVSASVDDLPHTQKNDGDAGATEDENTETVNYNNHPDENENQHNHDDRSLAGTDVDNESGGDKDQSFPLRLLVPSDMVGAIIGRAGATVRNISQQSRVRVVVHRKMEHTPSLETATTVFGQPENCTTACKRILEVMEEEARNVGKPPEIELKILAHNNLIGRIIGKQGGTIKKIMEVSAHCPVSSEGTILTV